MNLFNFRPNARGLGRLRDLAANAVLTHPLGRTTKEGRDTRPYLFGLSLGSRIPQHPPQGEKLGTRPSFSHIFAFFVRGSFFAALSLKYVIKFTQNCCNFG